MRCLTLAQALNRQGALCRFICRNHQGHLLDRIRKAGFEAVSLPLNDESAPTVLQGNEPLPAHAHWLGSDLLSDAAQTIDALGGVVADWLIVDHYAIDYRWESQLRPHFRKIMIIDDLADRYHDCDLLLDQNLIANQEHRYDNLLPRNCARLLGPRFALLHPHYAELHPLIPPRLGPVQRILVYFGGADNQNMTGRAIEAFQALERTDIALDVVINPASPHAASLRAQVEGHGKIIIHEELPNLAELMVRADLAIGAGGATSWERCCLGLPALVVTLEENQTPIAAELASQGLVRWLGHQDSVTVSKLKGALRDVLLDEDHLAQSSSRCRTLLDGRGGGRVAEVLLLNSSTHLTARSANLGDEDLILQLANDPLFRQNAFQPDLIDRTTHRKWFYKRLRTIEACKIYILETDSGMPIGQVRFELSGDFWEIHYGLAAIARGRGLGVPLLQTALQTFRQCRVGSKVFGRVKSYNLPSQKVFERLGFSTAAGGEGEIVYRSVL